MATYVEEVAALLTTWGRTWSPLARAQLWDEVRGKFGVDAVYFKGSIPVVESRSALPRRSQVALTNCPASESMARIAQRSLALSSPKGSSDSSETASWSYHVRD